MRDLKLVVKKMIPYNVYLSLIRVYNFFKIREVRMLYLIHKAPGKHRKALDKVKEKQTVKVAFFLTHESVWKYELLFDLMKKSKKFQPVLFVCPVVNYGHDNMLFEMDKTYHAFFQKGYEVYKTFDTKTNEYLNIQQYFSPDIIFYTNPYKGLQDERYYITQFPNTLTCYVSYAIMTVTIAGISDTDLHNLVWKNFSETPFHMRLALEQKRNKGRNNVLTGYPGFDTLLADTEPTVDIWKNKNSKLKKIIWAPHHSMRELNKVSNFLEYAEFFLDIASKYRNEIQIAFKPHHLLKVKLENEDYWGKQKTDAYYEKWDALQNGQVENGEYTSLFLSSDALIHDCGSFMAEYLVTEKPSLFMVKDESIMEYWNEFGASALAVHYQSRTKAEVISFIENVILNENDQMQEERICFVKANLLPQQNRTASEDILQHLEDQIFGI